MSKIKKTLIEKSNKQDIHNLSNKIINNVDTDKVIYTSSVKPSIFKPIFKIAGPTLLFTASAVLLTVAIMHNSEPRNNNTNTAKESSSQTSSSTEQSTNNDDVLIVIDSNNVVLDTYAKEVTTLLDVALSFNDLTFEEPALDLNTNMMTVSEEEYLVSDLSAYMDSIEGMLGLITMNFNCVYNTTDIYSEYTYILTVEFGQSSYSVYFNDEVINEKNKDKDNYKVDSNLSGVVVYENNSYPLTGSKRVENGSQEFNMKINLGDKYISVREDLASTNYFRYEYYGLNDELLKYVDIEQKKTEIDFQNAYDKTVLKLNPDNSINCKIKSRNSDKLTITKSENSYTYTFKNSGNVYNVD